MKIRWLFNYTNWNPTQADICQGFSSVQPEERIRLLKFVYQADLKASLAGRLMLRRAVAELTGLDNAEIQLLRTERGRPYVSGHPELKINLSHAGNFTVLAAQSHQNINHTKDNQEPTFLGIDVMPLKDSRINRTEDFFRIMKRQFTDHEWETIKSFVTESDQLASFYRHWCLKESYVKAVGTGLNIDLRTIEFHIKSEITNESVTCDSKVFIDGVLNELWFFEESLIDGHCVSVASNDVDKNVLENHPKFTEINPENLLEFTKLLDPTDMNYWEKYCEKTVIKPF